MDTLNMLISFGIKSVIDDDITMINDIFEHPEFSTENDLEGIIYEFGIKIDSIREMTRRLDIIVHDYDVYLKDELSYKLRNFKEKREKFKERISPNKSLSDDSLNYIQSDIVATSNLADDFSQLITSGSKNGSEDFNVDDRK